MLDTPQPSQSFLLRGLRCLTDVQYWELVHDKISIFNLHRYAFATFFPVYFFAYPELGLYVPIHWYSLWFTGMSGVFNLLYRPLLVFYLFLNFYLHCGYVIRPIEAVLSPLYVMSSEWHNVILLVFIPLTVFSVLIMVGTPWERPCWVQLQTTNFRY